MVLEGHFDGEGQAVELHADRVAGQGGVGLAGLVALVAEFCLEFGADADQAAAELLLQLCQARAVAGVAFAAGGEHVGNFLVAVDIEKQVDADLTHLLLDEQHLGALVRAGRLPGAVEILAGGVGAQVATHGAIRIHVRHQVEVGLLQQGIQFGVVALLQALDQPFHEPFGHVLAGVLLGDDPDLALRLRVAADAQQLDVAALDAFTRGEQLGTGLVQRLLDQPVMARAAVGLEVGEPDLGLARLDGEVERTILETAGHAEPGAMIVRGNGVVAAPGMVVGRLAGVAQAEAVALARGQTLDFEMEPLEVIAVEIGAHGQQHPLRVAGVEHLDIAAVEVTVDVHGYLASLMVRRTFARKNRRSARRMKCQGRHLTEANLIDCSAVVKIASAATRPSPGVRGKAQLDSHEDFIWKL
ncbi:hypothetical protein D3C85_836750 [compost metagenome]